MRVALFDAYPHAFAGAQRASLRIALGLAERGHEVVTIVPAAGPFVDELRAAGCAVQIVEAPPALSVYGRQTTGAAAAQAALYLPRYWQRVRRTLRDVGADSLHVNDHRGMLLAGPASRLAGVPIAWHIHALEDPNAITRLGVRLASAVVAPGAGVLRRLPLLAGAGFVVVPNPAPVLDQVELVDAPELVTVARLHPDKGLDVLIDALVQVRAAVPAVRATVVGGPQEGYEGISGELVASAAAAGVEGLIEFVGEVPASDPWLCKAAVYVQPSRERTEVLPLAMLEAMARGLPIVATRVGCLDELVVPGATGELVPPEEPAALADALIALLSDGERRRRYGSTAWARARSDFTLERFVGGVAAVHESLAARSGPATVS